jgi:hypothetical protein
VDEANERSDDAAFAAVLFVVALGLRLAAAFWLAQEPVWDGHYYDVGAHGIASGHGYAADVNGVWRPWCHYPVGYSAYLAAFYMLLGNVPWAPHVANGLAGAALAVMTFLLAREGLSPLRARVAGLLVALHPGLVLFGALLMSEPLSALGVMTAFWAALRMRRAPIALRHPLAGPIAGALVLGVAALVRPQALLCAPFLALAVPKKRMVAAVVACVVSVIPVLPWTARNCEVMDGCALVSTNGGWNLAIGSFPRATGRFVQLKPEDGCREVTGQVQQDRCWLALGARSILADPVRWIGLMPEKLSQTFDHESFAVEYLNQVKPAFWANGRRELGRAITTSAHRVLVAASALAGIALVLGARLRARARRVQTGLLAAVAIVGAIGAFAVESPTFWPIVLLACAIPWLPLPGRPRPTAPVLLSTSLLATVALTHAVFFGEDRYHVVAIPALCLLAASAFRGPEDPLTPL